VALFTSTAPKKVRGTQTSTAQTKTMVLPINSTTTFLTIIT